MNVGRCLASRLVFSAHSAAAALCLFATAAAAAPTASVTCAPASWSREPVHCVVEGSRGAYRALVWTETLGGRTDTYAAGIEDTQANPVLLSSTTELPHLDTDQTGRIYIGVGDTVTRYDESGAGTILLADACGAGAGAGGAVTNLAFTADGTNGAVTCHDDETGADHLMFWDGRSLRELRQASAIWGVGQSIDISADGSTIAAIGANVAGCAHVCVYETSTLTGYATVLASPEDPPQALAFVGEGRDIIFSGSDPVHPPYEIQADGPRDSEAPLPAAAGEHVLRGLDGTDALVRSDAGENAALDSDGNVVYRVPAPVARGADTPELQSAVLADDGPTTTRYRIETSPGSGQFSDWTDIANGTALAYATDGASRIEAQAQNQSGTSAAANATASYDATPPSLVAGGLSYGHVVGDVALFATATDDASGVGSVVFQYRRTGDADWQPACAAANSFGSGYGCDWYVYGLANGSYEWRAEASDKVGNLSVSDTGTATVAQSPVAQSNPTISGTAREGEVLQETDGSFLATEPLTYSLHWQRSTDGGVSWSEIAGQSAHSYTLTAEDVGAQVRVRMTASGQEESASADSAPSDIVVALTPPPEAPTVRITRAPTESLEQSATTVQYAETGVVTATACTLDGASTSCSASEATLTGLHAGQHTFKVEVSGPGGTGSDTAPFAVTQRPVPPVPPVPPPAVTITSAPPISITGGEAITYAETGEATDTSCTLNGIPVSCSKSVATFVKLPAGTYRFAVSATGPGGKGTAQAGFTVKAQRDAPPVARAVGRRVGPRSKTQTFRLDARSSYDPDGRIVTWRWLDASGRVLGRGPVATVRLRAGQNARFRLIVTDNRNRSSAFALRVAAPTAGRR
jgi:hypothetical protein